MGCGNAAYATTGGQRFHYNAITKVNEKRDNRKPKSGNAADAPTLGGRFHCNTSSRGQMQSGNAVDAPTGRSHSNQQQSTMHLPFHFSFSID